MATTTTPDNIYVLESSDPDEPLAWQPAMATSVQNALLSRALQTFKWANTTERNAQVGMVEGDLGFQADTGFTYQYDGVLGWQQVLPVVVPPLPGRIIASGAITAQSSFNIDGLTGASRYEVTLDLPVASTANAITAQLRASGVADSTSNYDRQLLYGASSTAAASASLGQTSWSLTAGDRLDKFVTLEINNLNSATRTVAIGRAFAANASAEPLSLSDSFRHRLSTSFDGIGFTISTGTVTGTYTVRAY